MPLNYEAQHDFGGTPAWSFVDENGERLYLDNPVQAMQLGAPVMGAPAAPPAMPDQRLAMNDAGATPDNPVVTDALSAPMAPPPPPDAMPPQSPAEASMSGGMSDPDAPMSEGVYDGPPSPQVGGDAPQPQGMQQRQPMTLAEAVQARNQSNLVDSLTNDLTYQPGRVGIPAHMQLDRVEHRAPPGTVEKFDAEYSALREKRQLEAEQNYTEALQRNNYERDAALREAVDQDTKARELERVKALQKTDQEKRLAALNGEISDITGRKVNPNRFWDDADAGTTILAAVSLALGAFGSSVNGGPNQAADIINTYIDRDTQRQRDAISADLGKAEQKKGAYIDWLNAGNSWQTTEAMLKAAKQKQAEAEIRQDAADEQDVMLKQQKLETANMLHEGYLEQMATVQQLFGSAAAERFIPEQRAIAGGLRKMTPEEMAKRDAAYASSAESRQKLLSIAAANGVDPEKLQSNVKEFGKALETKGLGTEVAYNRVDSLRQELLKKHNGGIPGIGGFSSALPDAVVDEDALRYRTAVREVAEQLLRQLSGAAASNDEKESRNEQIHRLNDPLTSTETMLQIYDDARRAHTNLVRGIAAGYGGAPTWDAWQSAYRSTAGRGNLTDTGVEFGDPVAPGGTE